MSQKYPVILKSRLPIAYHPAPKTSDKERDEIQNLIKRLGTISQPDMGYSGSSTGVSFAPVPGSARAIAFLLGGTPPKPDPIVRELVRFGGKAIPYLLESMEDPTPTRLTFSQNESGFPRFLFLREIYGNPANPAEKPFLTTGFVQNTPKENASSYTAQVGDLCFVILGQIIGRDYEAVRYVPSGIVGVNSPVLDFILRDAVRRMWEGSDPRKVLFDSLLTDYASEGIFDGESLDSWSVGSNLQIPAALRLLYYFPTESVPPIAKRIANLQVRLPFINNTGMLTPSQSAVLMKREVANGVQTARFLQAVGWCPDERIQSAMRGVAQRTNDPRVRKALANIAKAKATPLLGAR